MIAARCGDVHVLIRERSVVSQPILLSLVNGPWQALSLVATLRSRKGELPTEVVALLVDMVHGSAFHAATTRILQSHGVVQLYTIPASVSLGKLPSTLAQLHGEGLRMEHVRWIATYGMHRPVARYLLNVLPKARVLIYEEGLRAYVPPNTSLRDRLRMKLARAWGIVDRDFGLGWTPPRAWSEAEYSLLLSDRLPLPAATQKARTHFVPTEHLQAAIATLPAPTVRDLPARPYALIIGQYYARLKQMSPQVELETYVASARAILARGHVPIWKGHARERDDLFLALRERCAEVRNFSDFVDDASLPVELYRDFFGARCAAAISLSSSALFYIARLHGIPTFTLLTEPMLRRMRHPHVDACRLAREHVSPFSQSIYDTRPD